jgi:dGTPase
MDDVRRNKVMICFSDSVQQEAKELKQFLHTHLYRHYQVNRMSFKANQTITSLFKVMMDNPNLLPPDYQIKSDQHGVEHQQKQARKIADYIAGMTDRFAMKEHKRVFLIDEV